MKRKQAERGHHGLTFYIVDTLFRAFRSWPRMLAKGIQLPPIIHLFQLCCDGKKDLGKEVAMPNHIARCITLCKMWVGQAEGSGQIVQDAIRGEAECILAKVCALVCVYLGRITSHIGSVPSLPIEAFFTVFILDPRLSNYATTFLLWKAYILFPCLVSHV